MGNNSSTKTVVKHGKYTTQFHFSILTVIVIYIRDFDTWVSMSSCFERFEIFLIYFKAYFSHSKYKKKEKCLEVYRYKNQ